MHPVVRRLPPEHHIVVEQGLLGTFGRVMPVLMPGSLLQGVAYAVAVTRDDATLAAPTLALSTATATNGDTVSLSGNWNNNAYFGSDTTPDDPGETRPVVEMCRSDLTGCHAGCAPSCVVRVSQEGYDYDAFSGLGTGTYSSARAPITVSAPMVGPPGDVKACKDQGWRSFNNPAFESQGRCVASVQAGVGRPPVAP